MPEVAQGHIRFAPSILRRLGEELNPNIDQGILELVKNAYDADATECHVWLDGVDEEGTVAVEDNGDGMDADDITKGWLVLGDSRKQTGERTRLGRVPAGNKGLGRLAALRLGHEAHMISSPRGSDVAFGVRLNWDTFDEAETVDEVAVAVSEVIRPRVAPGTRIELRRMRDSIGRVDARKLARALVLLADPFGDQPDSFKPVLHSGEFDDLAELVTRRYFDDAEFHLIAQLRSGVASASVTDWRGNVLWQLGEGDELSKGAGAPRYDAPDTDFDLWVFLLDQKLFTGRNIQLSAVREWLHQFGGIHIYVDGIRVAPYGNPGDDWLGINLSRVRNPEVRPGTNTSIGRLRVHDSERALVQKTDRSGFIESESFAELTRFARDAMDWLARQRLREAEQKRQKARESTRTETQVTGRAVQERIEEIPDDEQKKELQSAFRAHEKARERENETLRKEVQLYRTLSTAGITAATFAHESMGSSLKSISIITNTLKSLLRRDLPDTFESRYSVALDRISGAVTEVGVLSSATLGLVSEEKRRIGQVRLNQVIRNVTGTFAPFLEGRKVKLALELSGPGEPFIRASEAAVESIVTNLVNNSLAAFERTNVDQRRLLIRTEVVDSIWTLTVADNGPGIDDIDIHDIWLPGQTRRPGGTGLGLTIVRDTLEDLGGEADTLSHGELGGATFTIRVELLGVDHG
ncbi:ATP-binding protein [Microbacterium trichothecenolyticum]